MTHKLYLGTTDSFRNKELALAANEDKDSGCDEEEAAMLVRRERQRNSREKKPSNTICPTMDAIGLEVLTTSSKIVQHEKLKRQGTDKGNRKTTYKRNSSKTDFCKAMIAAWGESKSEEETENPKKLLIYVSRLHMTVRL